MALTNSGRDELAKGLIGAGTPFVAANSFICVGDSTAAFNAAQTDLQATSNKLRKRVDAGYPKLAQNVLTFRSTFLPTEANFAWQEWGVANSSTAGTLFNRVVEFNGTKVLGQTWVFEVSLTISIGN